MIKIRTLNLQHGGGTRACTIAKYLTSAPADILVLSEFRDNASGTLLRKNLDEAGFKFWKTSHPPLRMNGVAVAAKLPFTAVAHPSNRLPQWECRWLECDFSDFSLVAAYFPGGKSKLEYWQWFMAQANARVLTPCILVGDFNTGKHYIDEIGATFYGTEYMTELESRGWIDAWRHLHVDEREFTWRSNAGGEFRLDYAWLSTPMVSWLRQAEHDHLPRSTGITDHSALWVGLNPPARN